MKTRFSKILLGTGVATALALQGYAQDVPTPPKMVPAMTEFWEPEVKTVAAPENAPPADAIVLFDGKNLDQWVSVNDATKGAGWTVGGGTFTVKKGTGNIQT